MVRCRTFRSWSKGALALGAALLAPLPAFAQQTPCTGCAISRAESAAQVRGNQAAVQSTLQNALNSQLQTQSNALQTQALLRSAQLNGQLNSGALELQRLLILQQLQLLQIEQRPAARVKTSKPSPKRRSLPRPGVPNPRR